MLASIFNQLGEFLFTGLVSLGLVVSTIRAFVAKAGTHVEEAGLSAPFMFCFALAMGVYVYVSLRSCFYNGDDESDWDEEEAIMVQTIRTPSKIVFVTPLGEPVISAKLNRARLERKEIMASWWKNEDPSRRT